MRSKYINDKKNDLNREGPNMMEQTRNIERRENSSPKLVEAYGSNYQYDDQYQKKELSDY